MQEEEETTGQGTATPTAAAARLTFLALYKPLQIYAAIQGLLHASSLIADWLDHFPHHHSAHPISAPLTSAPRVLHFSLSL